MKSMRGYMKVGLTHFMAYPSVMKGEGAIEEAFRKITNDLNEKRRKKPTLKGRLRRS